jgi:hypothetical protein
MMKQRSALSTAIVTALLIVLVATGVQTGGSSDVGEWVRAQGKTPLLWVIDILAVIIALGIGLLGEIQSNYRENMRMHDEEYSKKMTAMLDHTTELAKINDEYADQIASLEAAASARQEALEEEARRLTEQAFRALHGQVEANARQLDAVNMALQYQRGELRELRHGFRTLQSPEEASATPRLTSAERAAIAGPEPDLETLQVAAPALTEADPQTRAARNARKAAETVTAHAIAAKPEEAPTERPSDRIAAAHAIAAKPEEASPPDRQVPPADAAPEPQEASPDAVASSEVSSPEAEVSRAKAEPGEKQDGLLDQTVNDPSTLIINTVDFDVAYESSAAAGREPTSPVTPSPAVAFARLAEHEEGEGKREKGKGTGEWRQSEGRALGEKGREEREEEGAIEGREEGRGKREEREEIAGKGEEGREGRGKEEEGADETEAQTESVEDFQEATDSREAEGSQVAAVETPKKSRTWSNPWTRRK